MFKSYLRKIKERIVKSSGNWFYPSQKLPIGTHLGLFFRHRVDIKIKTVFDVGANKGCFSRYMLNYLPTSNFLCFEPFPDTFDILKSNLSHAKFVHFQLAFGEKNESLIVSQNDLKSSDTNSLIHKRIGTSTEKKVHIDVVTLDSFIVKNEILGIDLLKIDTEGYDLKVLKGAIQSLYSAKIKFIYVECGLDPSNQYHVYFPEFLSLLTQLGYVFIGFFQTDIRKIEFKNHFSNALFVHHSYTHSIKTFL